MEINSSQLWKERFHAFFHKFLRYMRLIGNSGLIFSFILLVIFGSYYYSLLIKQIPEPFPVFFCIAVVMTFVISKVNIRTFLKKADVVFLLAAEERMQRYFSLSLIYNLAIQVAVTLLVAIVFAPLYISRADESAYSYKTIIALFLLNKVWNVLVYWQSLKMHGKRAIYFDKLLRTLATFIFVYFALIGASVIYVLIVAFIQLLFLGYVSKVVSHHQQLNWERLLDMEEKLVMRFLKFVHAFVDVPVLAQRVKKRRWANVFASFIRHEQKHVAYFLYIKAFFRSGEYFGIYGRLFIIGLLIVVFMPYHVGKMLSALLFVYMTAVQILPLYFHYLNKESLKLYPINRDFIAGSFVRMFTVILTIENIAFAIGMWISGVAFLYVVACLLAAFLLMYIYVNRSVKMKPI